MLEYPPLIDDTYPMSVLPTPPLTDAAPSDRAVAGSRRRPTGSSPAVTQKSSDVAVPAPAMLRQPPLTEAYGLVAWLA